MRRRHWLRLWRPALTQEDRQHEERPNGEKLALPVLERLEPEARRADVAECRDGVATVRDLLLVELLRAANGVQRERDNEERGERDAQRMLVELEHDPAAQN